jgi:hypothetical protein
MNFCVFDTHIVDKNCYSALAVFANWIIKVKKWSIFTHCTISILLAFDSFWNSKEIILWNISPQMYRLPLIYSTPSTEENLIQLTESFMYKIIVLFPWVINRNRKLLSEIVRHLTARPATSPLAFTCFEGHHHLYPPRDPAPRIRSESGMNGLTCKDDPFIHEECGKQSSDKQLKPESREKDLLK